MWEGEGRRDAGDVPPSFSKFEYAPYFKYTLS